MDPVESCGMLTFVVFLRLVTFKVPPITQRQEDSGSQPRGAPRREDTALLNI